MGAATTILNALRNVLPTFAKSDASIEAKIIDAVGAYADAEAIERSNTLDVIRTALASQKVTTVEYYRRKAVAFQLGDTLVYDPINQGGYYSDVDPEKQIIKQAYIVEAYPNYVLLVNKLGNDGRLTTLTADELASFDSYFDAFQPLGLRISVSSLQVAKIYDPNMVVYVRAGSDSTEVAAAINANLRDYEAILRNTNLVTLSEIEDVIQRDSNVLAIGWNNPYATDFNLDGSSSNVYPSKGLFKLTSGAFTFATDITSSMIKVLR